MIDSKIIGMSGMKKYRGAEVFRNVIVELMAGSQSNYGRRISDTKITPPDDAKMMKIPKIQLRWSSLPFHSLLPRSAQHKSE